MNAPIEMMPSVVGNNVEIMVCVAASEKEFHAALDQAEALGLRLASMSNTGLPAGQVRLGFLPASAFADRPNYDALNDSYGLKSLEPSAHE